ncbi:MAG: hypothetical protein AAF828_09185 [Bacteroidota bacterium]
MSSDTKNTQGKRQPEQIADNADYHLLAPDLLFEVADHGNKGRTVRSDAASLPIDAFAAACEAAGARMMREFKLDLEGAVGGAATKRSDGELELNAAKPIQLLTPKKDELQSAVLHQDEYGELRWILPTTKHANGQKVFNLPPMQAGPAHRGPVTQKIRRIVKVIAWLAKDVVGQVALNLVTNWEKKHRPYKLLGYNNRQFTATPNWDRLREGKSLLFIHGTFSTAEAAYEGLLKDEANIKALEQAYEGRIFAFNHPSLHANPAGNIQELMTMLPPDMRGKDVDIVTHSRGGLVGRELMAHTQAGTSPGLKVNKAILVAGPHQGTILTKPEHWISLMDTYTNLLLKLPDGPITIILESIISLIKIIGGNTVSALPGLQSMLPKGNYLNDLGSRSLGNAQLYTMGARYLPMGDNLVGIVKSLALKVVLKKLFGEDSDMVVPTGGSLNFGPEEAPLIPRDRQMLYDSDSAVNHLNFFTDDRVNGQLVSWLTEQQAV